MNESNRITAFLTLVLILLCMVLIRVYVSSASENRRGEEAAASGDFKTAIVHYGRSIKWYAPFNPWVKESIDSLWEIGEKAYKDSDLEMANFALTTLRSSLYAVRGPFSPFRGKIKKVDDWRATYLIAPDAGSDTRGAMAPVESDREPDRFWSAMAGLGMVGWILSVFAFIFFVFTPDGERIKMRKAILVGFFIGAFYVLWLCGLYLT